MFKLRKIKIPKYEHDVVFGSRKVIKDPNNPNQQHYYATSGDDLWTHYGKRIADLIPANMIVYGELIGWTPDGAPIQKNYTYDLPQGQCELYVYRVAHVNVDGVLSDLSWDGVVEFCKYRGLKWAPELCRVHPGPAFLDRIIDEVMDERIAGLEPQDWLQTPGWKDDPVIVSSHKTVDEGVCIRQEGFVPTILKAKSPKFLEHETKLLDEGDSDMESAA